MQLKGFSHFQIIAEGGMAILYRAIQTSLDRPVAIKVLKAGLADTPQARQMFERESRIIAKLDHPNIIRVIDKGITEQGMPYFVMDYVEGCTLHAAIKQGMTPGQKVRVAVQIAKALSYAHKNNIVHRDIKPGNILIDKEENTRVVDFGIALLTEDSDTREEEAGLTVGTLSYMAPEQHSSASFATPASDIYSLGVLMYLMFTGTRPWPGCPSPHKQVPQLPEALGQLVMRCLAESPGERPNAESLASTLIQSVQGMHLTDSEVQDARETFNDPREKFRLLDVIRETGYGALFLYENRSDHSLMVLKKRNGNESGFSHAEWLQQNPHPNLVRVLGASKNSRIFIVVMEYLSGGSLQNRMLQAMSPDTFLPIAHQICNALQFLHEHGLVHGNLRPHNVLFDGQGLAKVSDPGYQPHYQESPEANWYLIPEEPLSTASDVFAAGVIFYQMLSGGLPQWKRGILMPNETFSQLPDSLQSLVKSMIFRDPEIRPANLAAILERLPPAPAIKHLPTNPATGAATGAARDAALEGAPETAPESAKAIKRRNLWWAAATLISVNLALGAWLVFKKFGTS